MLRELRIIYIEKGVSVLNTPFLLSRHAALCTGVDYQLLLRLSIMKSFTLAAWLTVFYESLLNSVDVLCYIIVYQ